MTGFAHLNGASAEVDRPVTWRAVGFSAPLVDENAGSPKVDPLSFVLGQDSLRASPEAQQVKLSLLLSRPLNKIKRLELESCSDEFHDGVEVFLFPNLRRYFAEGGSKKVTIEFADLPVEFQTLAIGFRHNRGVCLGKLQLYNEKGIAVRPRSGTDTIATHFDIEASLKRQKEFADKGYASLLDVDLVSKSNDDHWIFRFRRDGTFFVFGESDGREVGPQFSALGEYELLDMKSTSLQLKLHGFRFVTHGPWDGFYCGEACGQRTVAGQKAVDETLEIQRSKNGMITVHNRVEAKERTLPFADFQLRAKTD